jgi:hypothetical protein
MSRSILAGALLAALLLVPSNPVLAGSSVLGSNLVVNGDAESGPGSTDGSVVSSIPGFTTTGAFTVVQYGAAGGYPDSTSPGPANRGANFFAGGPGAATSTGSQFIDVSSASAQINTGKVTYDLSGYLGGFSSQGDNAVVTATFMGVTGAPLGTATIGPVTPAQRNDVTGLLFQDQTGMVPVGTEGIDFVITMNRLDGSYNDGYADNLSLVLAVPSVAVPEPTGLTLAGVCLGGLVLRIRRKMRLGTA